MCSLTVYFMGYLHFKLIPQDLIVAISLHCGGFLVCFVAENHANLIGGPGGTGGNTDGRGLKPKARPLLSLLGPVGVWFLRMAARGRHPETLGHRICTVVIEWLQLQVDLRLLRRRRLGDCQSLVTVTVH